MYTHRDLLDICRKASKYKTFSVGELEVLIKKVEGRDSKSITIIAIRGTESGDIFSGGGWRDIARNLLIIPYSPIWAKGIGHRGFLRGSEEVMKEVCKRVSTYETLLFTGHSLGAAVGLGCSMLATTKGYTVKEFVGFGTPRVFYFEKGKREKDVKYTLYRNGKDIVTKLPLVLGKRVNKITSFGKPSRPWYNISDHPISEYLENM